MLLPDLARAGDGLAGSEQVLSARRVAAGYLRTGNIDLAALALERLAKALAASPYEGDVKAAQAALDAGDTAEAGVRLEQLAERLATARREAGQRVLADCIRDVSHTYRPLDQHRTTAPDLAQPALRTAIIAAAAATDQALARCDAEAPPAVRGDDNFRRLLDGAQASLKRLPDVVNSGDAELLYRFLIELRSFEQLLLFRFG